MNYLVPNRLKRITDSRLLLAAGEQIKSGNGISETTCISDVESLGACKSQKVSDRLRQGFTIRASVVPDSSRAIESLVIEGRQAILDIAELETLCGFYSTRKITTPRHYDRSAVIVVQLAGIRTVGVDSTPMCHLPQEDKLVHEHTGEFSNSYRMEAGDVLYIPPGHVHASSASGETVTLGMGFWPFGENERVFSQIT